MRHLPHLRDLTRDQLREILDFAHEMKRSPQDFRRLLEAESLAMIFQKTSTRTRVSFEVGMTQLGGHALYLDWTTTNLTLAEIEHEIAYLSRNVSCILARVKRNSDFLKIMHASLVPVINGCCERSHPCQALTDVMTMQEHSDKPLQDIRLNYLGVMNNVAASLVEAAALLGFQLTLTTPEPSDNANSVEDGDLQRLMAAANIRRTAVPEEGLDGADFVYTDTWVNMEFFGAPDMQAENRARIERMKPWQLSRRLLGNRDLRIMHDMPIHVGHEIEAELVRDPRSIIYQQAENRLHAQKGLLRWLYREAGLINA